MIDSKNIIVTGASRGLGSEIARALSMTGANLFLVARDEKKLAALAREINAQRSSQQEVFFFGIDLANENSADRVVQRAREVWGSIFGLVNNAGILGPIGKAWKNDWEAWQETIKINLLAPVALCRTCVPWMAESGCGKIVNLSGGGATGPRPNFSAYAVAKTGIVRFTEILAEEISDLNIQVNCIAPGALNTDMLQKVLDEGREKVGDAEHSAALRQDREGGADPRLAAELCAFLMSSRSDKITGKLISALWDPWRDFSSYEDDLAATDIYTLRRIVPEDRGKNWGNVK